jgi:uncharacterized lipoprotein
MRSTVIILLVSLLLLACGTTDNSRYKDNANLERPPELPVNKQTDEQAAVNELETPVRRHGKGLKSDVYTTEGSPLELKIKRSFDEAWSLLSRAIEHNDLKVPDQDRSKGLYYVAYDGSGLFGSAASLLGGEKNQPTYMLKVEPQGEETQVTVSFASKDEQNDADSLKDGVAGSSSEDQSAKLLELLYDTLHDDIKNE